MTLQPWWRSPSLEQVLMSLPRYEMIGSYSVFYLNSHFPPIRRKESKYICLQGGIWTVRLLGLFLDISDPAYNQTQVYSTKEKEECFCNWQEAETVDSCKYSAWWNHNFHILFPCLMVFIQEHFVKFSHQLHGVPSMSTSCMSLSPANKIQDSSFYRVSVFTEPGKVLTTTYD